MMKYWNLLILLVLFGCASGSKQVAVSEMSKDEINKTLGFSQKQPDIVKNKIKPPKDPEIEDSGLFPSTVPIDKVPDLINDAKAVQDMMNQQIGRAHV